ncbi:MAG: hypothetical protein LBG05_02315, partial [Treponema sp.]|nr:hypothetical protein [Treponema sp.]
MRKAILAILTICGLVGVLLGCSNPLGNPQDDAATGTVLVQVAAVGAADASARTVGPSAADFAEYRLVFAQDTTVIAEVMTQDENGKAFDLKPGTWTLTVTGYIDVDGEKKAAVSGTSAVTIAAGRTVSATVSLSQSVTDTYGTFDYSAIDFSAVEAETLTGATLTIRPSDPNSGVVTIDLFNENNSGALELPAGIYTALVELTSGRSITISGFNYALNAYREEAIYIYPYMTTALRVGEYEFSETDFIADLYFTGTTVIDEDSTGTDTYTPKRVFIIKAVDNEGYVIDSDVPFEERLIAEAEIDEEGNWELYIPSNSIADKIKAPFSSHGEYQDLSGYPVFFAFEMQSQQHPANTMQSRWVWQEIVNKHGKRDIELKATIRKITVPITWGTVEGGSAVQTNSGYDVVYVE